jgi:hypothetical protein
VLDEWKKLFEEHIFKQFGYNGQETDWPVGGWSVGRLPWLKDEG